MDFVSDALFDGRRIRALTLVDNFTREALAIVVDGGIRGEHVVRAVEEVAAQRDPPWLIRVDNGPEFVSKVLDRWAYERGVTLDFSRPASPSTTASWNPSTGASATSASTRIGSCRSRTPKPRSKLGGGTTMRFGLTVPWGT